MSTNPVARYALPVAAAGLFGFAAVSTIKPGIGRADPPIAPSAAPYAATVAGVGVVEPESEMISVATELPGVVREVNAKPGVDVAKGAPLFRLDDRALRAGFAEAAAALENAKAAASQADVALADARRKLSFYDALQDPRAASETEKTDARFAVERAEAAASGARANVEAAGARVLSVKTDLERLTVRAPIAGRVFSVKVRPGEFAQAGPQASPLLTMGSAGMLHVRVEIDEADVGRLSPNSKAQGALRGRTQQKIPLSFVRFEPQAVEKRSLAGGSERVDTRVIEAIYAFKPSETGAFVGQRMDVFIDAAPLSAPVATAGAGR